MIRLNSKRKCYRFCGLFEFRAGFAVGSPNIPQSSSESIFDFAADIRQYSTEFERGSLFSTIE